MVSPLLPVFLSYVLSFVYVGIYWNNHHHLLQATTKINGKILWANLHLLFWLSLIPFTTGWMGEHHATLPTALYGLVLLMAGVAYLFLQRAIVAQQGKDSKLHAAMKSDVKGPLSAALYIAAMPLALVNPWLAEAVFVIVALMWFIPDRRIESHIG